MLTDAAALALALVALRIARRPPRGAMTYGFGRVEILSAQANGITLVLLALWIVYEAIARLVSPPDVEGAIVVVVAIVGIVVNLAATFVLAGASRESLNVEGSFQHILTDLFAFIATAIAGGIILATGFVQADALASLLVAASMLYAGTRLVMASGRVFLEAAPEGLDPQQIGRALAAHPGVVEVHDLHVWEVTSGFPALSAHVVVRAGSRLPRAAARAPAGAGRALRAAPHDAAGRPRGGRAAAAADRDRRRAAGVSEALGSRPEAAHAVIRARRARGGSRRSSRRPARRGRRRAPRSARSRVSAPGVIATVVMPWRAHSIESVRARFSAAARTPAAATSRVVRRRRDQRDLAAARVGDEGGVRDGAHADPGEVERGAQRHVAATGANAGRRSWTSTSVSGSTAAAIASSSERRGQRSGRGAERGERRRRAASRHRRRARRRGRRAGAGGAARSRPSARQLRARRRRAAPLARRATTARRRDARRPSGARRARGARTCFSPSCSRSA